MLENSAKSGFCPDYSHDEKLQGWIRTSTLLTNDLECNIDFVAFLIPLNDFVNLLHVFVMILS